MTAAHRDPILHHIRRLVAGVAPAPSDRELLRDYLERRDEAAFAVLVEHHGPMVLGVCRAVLGHRHDAEDAFQATFLVLARKARSIRRRDNLASWLHGVAFRVAKQALAVDARRRALMAKLPVRLPRADELSRGEVRAILHAELAALPERFLEPLVLCYLEGLTQEEAARRLGWSAATLHGRLQRGRQRLRRRLERRGLGLGAALGTVALAEQAQAAHLPAALAAATVRAALPGTGGGATAALAHEMLKPMVPIKLWATAAVLLAGVALAGGAGKFAQKPVDGEPAPAAPVAEKRTPRTDAQGDPLPEGAVARLGTVRFNHGEGLNALFFLPDGKTIVSEGSGFLRLWDVASGRELGHFVTAKPLFDSQSALTPDGKALVSLNQELRNDILRVWDLTRGKEARVVELAVQRDELSASRRNALAPDGRRCAVHTPRHVHVFDTTTGRELCRLPGAGDGYPAVVFAGNDKLVTADKEQRIAVWEAATGKLVRQFAYGSPVESLIVSSDGRRLAALEPPKYTTTQSRGSDVIYVWDLITGTRKHTLAPRPGHRFRNVWFTPDGKWLLTSSSGSEEYLLAVWDVENWRHIRDLEGAAGDALAVSTDGKFLAQGTWWGKFGLWDLQGGRRLMSGDQTSARAAAVFLSPTGDRASTIGSSRVGTWHCKTGQLLHSFDVPAYDYPYGTRPSFSPDGRYALNFARDGNQIQLIVFDVASGRRLHLLQMGKFPPLRSAFSPDSSWLGTAQGERNAAIRTWDVRTGKALRSFTNPKVGWSGRLFFSSDGKTLLVAGEDVGGWDPAAVIVVQTRYMVGLNFATGKELFAWKMVPPRAPFGARAFAASPTAGYSIAWRSLAVSPDGAVVAAIPYAPEPVAERIVLLDARTGRLIRRWSDSGRAGRNWEPLIFSPDGRLLASSNGDFIYLWEVATGQAVRTFRGHRNEVEALAFSANGRRLASSSGDGTVLIWDLVPPLSTEKEVAGWWADLSDSDARKAYAATWRLAEAPAASVPFLRGRLKPIRDERVEEIRRLIADLDSNVFTVRKKASQQLDQLGPPLVPTLRQALEMKPSPEVRRRVEQLLEKRGEEPLTPASPQTLRALAALEHAGTPEARQLLQALADGAPGYQLTHEAKAACERLRRADRSGRIDPVEP